MQGSHRPSSRLRRVGVVIAILAAVAPSSAHAAADGVVPDITWGVSDKVQERTALELQAVSVDWVRAGISWSDWVEPSKGSYSSQALRHFDRGIDMAKASGARVMITVEESPSWARTSSIKNAPPDDNADLAAFMAFLANRYEGKVEAYQVWNEPNKTWAWPHGPNAGEYAYMLRDVAPAIRAADPTSKVLFAGLNRNDYSYLERAYAAVPNLGDYFDVMAVHPYVDGGRAPEAVWYDPNGRISKGAFSGYRELRKSMMVRGDVKPIWFTEFGWSTTTLANGVSPATQASYLTRAYQCLEQDSYVEVALWYNFRNEWWEYDADKWVTQLGLLTTDFTRKPAFYAMRDHKSASGTCTYGSATSPPPAPLPGPDPEPVPLPDPAPVPVGTPSTDPEPEPEPEPGTNDGDDDEGSVTSSSVRSSAMLRVNRARLKGGRLAISGRVARGATGEVAGVARFRGRKRRFASRIDTYGRIRVNKKLRGAKRARGVRVTLRYAGNSKFDGQRVTLKASRRNARLRVRQSAAASSAGDATRITGSVRRAARGSVVMTISYRTRDGAEHAERTRVRISDGSFAYTWTRPDGARNAVVQAVYRGDAKRRIAGGSATLKLASR